MLNAYAYAYAHSLGTSLLAGRLAPIPLRLPHLLGRADRARSAMFLEVLLQILHQAELALRNPIVVPAGVAPAMKPLGEFGTDASQTALASDPGDHGGYAGPHCSKEHSAWTASNVPTAAPPWS